MKLFLTIFLLLISIPAIAAEYADTIWNAPTIAPGFRDTKIYNNTHVTHNYGGSTTLTALANGATDTRKILVAYDSLASLGTGRIIDSMFIDLWGETTNNNTFVMAELLKPWYEGTSSAAEETGTVCYNEWYFSTDSNVDSLWGTAGANNVGNGSQNTSDGSGYDRMADTMDLVIVVVTDTMSYIPFEVDAAVAQDYYDGTKRPNGFIIFTTLNVISSFTASEATQDTLAPGQKYRPRIRVYSHDGGTPSVTTTPRRGRILR